MGTEQSPSPNPHHRVRTSASSPPHSLKSNIPYQHSLAHDVTTPRSPPSSLNLHHNYFIHALHNNFCVLPSSKAHPLTPSHAQLTTETTKKLKSNHGTKGMHHMSHASPDPRALPNRRLRSMELRLPRPMLEICVGRSGRCEGA